MKPSPKVHILEEDGKTFGLVLEADCAAEHEIGIKFLESNFGFPISVDQASSGIGARTMTTPFDQLNWIYEKYHLTEKNLFDEKTRQRIPNQKTRISVMGASDAYRPITTDKESADYLLGRTRWRYRPTDDFTAAWDDKAFLVAGFTPRAAEVLDFLNEGAKIRDFAIWLSSTKNPFGRGGLILARPSAIPEKHKQTMLDSDIDRQKLHKAAEATGIRARIDAKNSEGSERPGIYSRCGYSALSPRWISENKKETSKHPVMFWLNPIQQSSNNYGCFTVEDLDLWLEDKGPIPKMAKTA